MEEQWVKVAELQRVSNLVNEKDYIDNVKEQWTEILEQYKVKYKFDVTQGTEYKAASRTKGALQTVYILNLYTTKGDLQKVKGIINEYENSSSELPPELLENNEEKYTKYEENELMQQKLSRYFISAIMLLVIAITIGIMVSIEYDSNNIVGYILGFIFICIAIYVLIRVNYKKMRKNKKK